METPKQQLVKEVVDKVRKVTTGYNVGKLDVAYDWHWARSVLNWQHTDYGTWGNFMATEIKACASTVHTYITMVNKIEHFGFTKAECVKIIEAIGWIRFGIGLFLLKRKVKPETFIKRYENYPSTGYRATQAKKGKDPFGDRAYTFSLPAARADKLDVYLRMYGMTESPTGARRGVRDAFMGLVDNELE